MITDDELVVLARAGDDQAFAVLIRRHEPAVMRIARKLLRDEEEARDVAQETSIRVWRHLNAFDGGQAKYTSWLLTIASRLCFNRLRDKRRRRTVQVEDIEQPDRVLIANRRQDPDVLTAGRDLSERLDAALSELTPVRRRAIELRFLEGKSYAEIAEIMHVTLGTVKSRMNRARESLAAKLGQEIAA